jgi:hypothetical protein
VEAATPDGLRADSPTPLATNRPTAWAVTSSPTYAPVESRVEPGQIRAWEWMTVAGRRRFLAQEALLLSRWGVKPSHQGTCVLVPQLWAAVDPGPLISTFNYAAYTQLSDARLVGPLPTQ